MKKLMVVAASIVAAASLQAASVTWSAGAAMYGGGDEDYVAAPTFWMVALNGGSASDISVGDGGVLTIGKGMVDFYGESYTVDDAWSLSGEMENMFAKDNSQPYALVIWDGLDSADGGKYAVITSSPSGIADDPAMNGEMYFTSGYSTLHDEDASYLTQDVQSVPEPTSGLLLLLGVAGLALRRRRA